MERHDFTDFKGMREAAQTLDMCQKMPGIYRHGLTHEITEDPKRRDIINLRTGERTAVVSSIYQEYQHRDVIAEVADSFVKARIEGHGTVWDAGDRIMATCIFDNVKALKDPRSDRGIQIGARFMNSYNKQNSVTGQGYFMRIECLNQMVFSNMIAEMKFSERHTGSIIQALPESIARFTDNLLMRTELVATSIQRADETEVQFLSREQRLETMIALVDHKKVGELVDNKIGTLEPTKWDIYNAITQVATHERMGETIRERVERMSERVLAPDYRIVPAAIARAVA